MEKYAQNSACLRRQMIRYFGQNAPQECGNCSWCVNNRAARRNVRFPDLRRKGPAVDLKTVAIGTTVWHERYGEGRIA